MILVHRFELDAPFIEVKHSGIVTGLEDAYDKGLITTDTLCGIHDGIDTDLPSPNIFMGETMSFFTDRGYDKFADWIADTCEYIQKNLGGKIKAISTYLPEDYIQYRDKFQVIVHRKDVIEWLY